MSKVTKLKLVDLTLRNRIQTNKVLKGAVAAKLAKVIVIGQRDNGKIFMASSDAPETVMWDLEYAKKWLLEGCPDEGE